jgi:hypothetical protein
MGIDQQCATPAISAIARMGAHLGSSRRSAETANSPNQAAGPQVPTLGPIGAPSTESRYSLGSDGPTPECRVFDSGSRSSTEGMSEAS